MNIHIRLKRLEDRLPKLDGPALIAPADDGFGLHIGNLHKFGFATIEEAEEYLDELRRSGRTRTESVLIWDLADNYRERRDLDAE